MLDPRRPRQKPTNQELEEGLVQYDPVLPDNPKIVLSHEYEVRLSPLPSSDMYVKKGSGCEHPAHNYSTISTRVHLARFYIRAGHVPYPDLTVRNLRSIEREFQ